MNETQNGDLEKTADGDPLNDRGIADSANDSVTDPEADGDDEQADDDEDEEDEEDVGL
ncbi:MAG TPA: hypothetical protein VFW34_02125 [Candidatus Rubrimentiphilum sp.]|nr:hypothetical protein [Candidatus Rubrimentiphilum sp.]